MADNQQPQQPGVPKELEQELMKALHNICVFLHQESGASHIVLDIKHVSDAIMQVSQTLIGGAAMGVKMFETRGEQAQGLRESDPSKLAEDAINRAMNSAKNKGDK